MATGHDHKNGGDLPPQLNENPQPVGADANFSCLVDEECVLQAVTLDVFSQLVSEILLGCWGSLLDFVEGQAAEVGEDHWAILAHWSQKSRIFYDGLKVVAEVVSVVRNAKDGNAAHDLPATIIYVVLHPVR
jgi:hypothetical protein